MNEPTNSHLDIQVGGDHYKTMKVQPLEAVFMIARERNALGVMEEGYDDFAMAFIVGAFSQYIGKYLCRAGKKEGTDDAAKAAHVAKIFGELCEREGLSDAEDAEAVILEVASRFKEICLGTE